MKGMKKNNLYRVGAAFMAALMVITCVPQTSLYALAEEETPVQNEALLEEQENAEKEVSQELPEEKSDSTAPDISSALAENPVTQPETTKEGGETPMEDTPQIPVTSISFEKSTVEIDRAQKQTSATVKCVFIPNDANVDREVTFSSDNEDVIEVAKNGESATITAKGPGTAKITATTPGGKTAECFVEALPILVTNMEITMSGSTLEMKKNGTASLPVKLTPDDADNKTVIVRSSNSDVATVKYEDNTIKVTAVKSGHAVISVKADSNPRKVLKNIDVEVEDGKIDLTGLSAKASYRKNLLEGNSVNLTSYVEFTPFDATNKDLVWSVAASDAKYAEVDQKGSVTAKWENDEDTNESREVTITAASKETSTLKADFKINIIRNDVPLESFHLDRETLVLEDGGDNNHRTICVSLEPLTSTDREITATVSKKGEKTAVMINEGSVYKKDEAESAATARADANGRVYFTVTANALEGSKKQDTCTITFTKKGEDLKTADIKAQCQVTVNKYVTSVNKLELSERSCDIVDQETAELTAWIDPPEIENSNIIWTVSDPEIASIVAMDKDGKEQPMPADGKIEAKLNAENKLTATVKIKANMVGICEITATAEGNSSKKDTCIVTVSNGANPAKDITITSVDTNPDDTTEITLKKGQEYQLIPTVTVETPGDPANKKVKWTSNSPEVASVAKGENEVGNVIANELGECIITAQASGEDKACKKEVKVNVKNPLLEVKYKGTAPWKYTPDDQPITEEMLRKELEVFFYPREVAVPEKDKQTLGSGEKNNYVLTILREDKKTEKDYTPGDLEKPGTKILVVSYTYDGVTYKDTVAVTMEAFTKADLLSVTPLSGEEADIWNVPNGTSKSSLPLPETAEITVGREVTVDGKTEQKTSRMDVDIDWKAAESNYNPDLTEAQEFEVFGDVVLPQYIMNPNNVSTRIKTTVHVREQASSGKKMARPKFSVMGGKEIGDRTAVTMPYGTKIEISPLTETEDVEIYYMIDRRPDEARGIPHNEAHLYKSPIELTSKTTTIYAIAAKNGYADSDCSECTIKLEKVDPVDPDDPYAGPLPDDVTDEDREQIGGRVPDGLWAVVQMDAYEKKTGGFAYTGKAIKPAVRVYDRTMLLTEKKDYTLAYSNNVNAGSAVGSAKPPTITVTGKGNYEGKAVVHFTIKPQSIEDTSVLVDEHLAAAYNGKAQKPNPSLSWNGKKLSKNKDYSYADVSYTAPGIYTVIVEGIGNYEGKRTVNYEIYQGGISVSTLTVSKVANQKYTGSPIRPKVTVKNKKVELFEGTEDNDSGNYWIKYENCTEVGTASIVIVGKGAYKGSKRINFKILPIADVNKAGITLDVPPAGVAYTGKPHTPKCTVNYMGTELKENKDYKLSYQNNNKAGTATVVIAGMGSYTGTAKKTFKILQNDISGLSAAMGTSFAYEKGGCKPKPEVICNGLKLVEGTDYTLTYKNNNKIGNTANVTVKGKGNYKGQIVRYFEVTMQDISKLKVVASDKAYQQKKNIYKTKVQVIDLNGKALVAGTDYARDVYYTYENGSKAGQPVLSTDIIPAGTVIGVDVRVANPRCYQGTVHGTYRIVQADIAGAKVNINPQEYTGRSIRPDKSQIQVTLNGVLLGTYDYEIVGYENNVAQGNAKITIRGVGSYGGTKTAIFKIRKKGILNLKF